jgi:hypothetical protein
VTLADRALDVVLERGPLPMDTLAPAVGKRRTDVLAAVCGDERFVHVGSTKGSLWGAREAVHALGPPTFTVDELASKWGDDLTMGRLFVRDFLAGGYLESVNGNGRVRVTERGRLVSRILIEARS